MLSTLVSLSLLAGPHGLEAKDPVALVSQLEARLPKWLKHQGDRKALLATKAELEGLMKEMPFSPADQAAAVQATLEGQAVKPAGAFGKPERALVNTTGRSASVSFFDGKRRCVIGVLRVGDGSRYVATDGPILDDRTYEQASQPAGDETTVVALEKKSGKWALAESKRAVIAPPDCITALKNAAKAVYVAEKAYFAEYDAYQESLEKIGIEPTSVSGAKVSINVSGKAETATFSAELTQGGGVVKISDKSAMPEIVQACPK